jgi:hypothetical protein
MTKDSLPPNSSFDKPSGPAPGAVDVDEQARKLADDPYPWILHPAIDLLFCCGGFLCVLLVVLLASGITQEADMNSSWLGISLLYLNIGGQFIISSSHQPATLWRVYLSNSTRKSIGSYSTWTGVLFAAIGIIALFNRDLTGILVRITLAWSIQHTLAQAYGVSLIYCMKRKYNLSKRERDIFYWMFQTGLIYLVLRMFTYTNFLQGDLYGVKLPIIGPLPEWICTTALIVFQLNSLAFMVLVARKWWIEKTMMPFPALATAVMAFATLSMTYVLPASFVIFIPTFYHASQYLVVTTAYYLKERGLPSDVTPASISRMLSRETVLTYMVVIAATGALLYIGIPRLLYEMGFDKSLCLAVVYCVFNLHHYLTDAAIWKMRDPAIRKLLVA